MMILLRGFVCALATMIAAPVLACSCPFSPLTTTSALRSDHVFVFRLMDAQLQDDGAVIGRIQLHETIRGNGGQFLTVKYWTRTCCGSRLDVGHDYIAFVTGDAATFVANASSVVDIVDPIGGSSSGAIDNVRKMMDGKLSLDAALGAWRRERIFEVPAPPSPCTDSKSRAKIN